MPDGQRINYADWGLLAVQVEVFHGFVFVCLGVEPLEPLASLLADCKAGFARAQTERLKEACTITYDFPANWKVVMEGFFECYHCPVGHPALTPVVDVRAYEADSDDAGDAWQYGKAQCAFRPGSESFTIDGKFVSKKLLGALSDDPASAAGFNVGAYVQPSGTQVDVYADYASALRFHPLAIDRTQMTCQWFVREDAEECVDYEVERLTAMADVVNRQDQELTIRVQQGMSSRRYVPGPLHPTREASLRSALATYLDLMS
jgi:Rieske 2Fe-2S family protein